MTSKVIITKPERLAGMVATKNGDRFRYPSQNFYVQPVILENGREELAFSFREVVVDEVDRAAKYVNEFLSDKIVLNANPSIVYDYHSLLENSRCPSCNDSLNWILSNDPIKGYKLSDKFCVAECCGMQYGMVPQTVRVLAVPVAAIRPPTAVEDSAYADDEFMKELEQM